MLISFLVSFFCTQKTLTKYQHGIWPFNPQIFSSTQFGSAQSTSTQQLDHPHLSFPPVSAQLTSPKDDDWVKMSNTDSVLRVKECQGRVVELFPEEFL